MDIDSYLNNMDYVDAIMIIDRHGKIVYSVRYNPRFESDCYEDDFDKNIINRNFLEIYPNINPAESSMIRCINEGKTIYLTDQIFNDYTGRVIRTQNLTIPIFKGGRILGAVELSKDITKVEEQIKNTHNILRLNNVLSKAPKAVTYSFDDIITYNKEMLNSIERSKIIAENNSHVLIYGETGTGKELFVQSIHNHSDRKNRPFIAQNCAALPENLFESMLFGSTKGAFTGAVDKQGLFEEADGGTLYLDEINSMPLKLQAKLLRVLEDGIVRRVGDVKDKKVDVRIISSMNIEPLKAIDSGQLREDLFYRLSVANVKLIPLRDRKEDIMLTAEHFIDLYNYKYSKAITGISDEVKESFLHYEWPGNVRELKHIIETSIHFANFGEIEMIHLPVYLVESKCLESNHLKEYVLNKETIKSISLDEIVEDMEKKMIYKALDNAHGNISKAANLLKITRQRLHYKLDKYGINV